MKLSLFILLTSSLTCLAQPDSKWNFGFHAGVSSSLISERGRTLYVGDAPEQSIRPGFSFAGGLNAEYLLSKRLAIQTGINFQSAKSKWVINSQASEWRLNFSNQYLNATLIVTHSLISKDRFSLSAGVGSTLQFRLGSLVDAKVISYNNNHDQTSTVTGPSIILTGVTDFLLVSPTVQVAADIKRKHIQTLRFLASYSFSLNDPLPSRNTPSEFVYNYAMRFGPTKLQTISLTIQHYWRGLHPSKN
jgi:hypothetical protein